MASVERFIDWSVRAGSILVLPLSLLLFLQWPLREVVQAFSREANDLAQILFALYVAIAVTAATRAHSHLAVSLFSGRYRPRSRALLERGAALVIALPAAAFVLVSGARATWVATVQLERFPETMSSGYFLLRVAVMLLAVLVLAQAAIDLLAPRRAAG